MWFLRRARKVNSSDMLYKVDEIISYISQYFTLKTGDITYQKVIEDLNVLDRDNYFKLVDLALENKVSQMMLLLDNILGKGFDGGNMIQGLAQHVRNVMMAKDTQTLPLLETSEEQKAKYVEQAKKAPTPFLYKALQLMNNCDVQYRQSSNKRLLLVLDAFLLSHHLEIGRAHV